MSLLVASGGAGNAAAATEPPPSDDERVNYLIAAYGIAESEAEQRVPWQGEARRLTQGLTSRYSGSLAGVWIDHADGGKLKIATVGDSAPLVEHLRGQSTQPTNIVGLNNFSYTLKRLNEIQAELVRAREETEQAGHGSYGFRALRSDLGSTPSQLRGGLMLPVDAAAVQQES